MAWVVGNRVATDTVGDRVATGRQPGGKYSLASEKNIKKVLPSLIIPSEPLRLFHAGETTSGQPAKIKKLFLNGRSSADARFSLYALEGRHLLLSQRA